MKINGTIFSKPQQDQLRRAIESGGSGGGGSLTKHVVEMTTANYETIKNDFPRMVGATLDIEMQGTHYKGNSVSFLGDAIVAQVIEQFDGSFSLIGVRLKANRVDGMYYYYAPNENSLVKLIDQSDGFMTNNPTFTLTYWTE